MIVELRRYRIKQGLRDRFLTFFASRAIPAQERCGMRILGVFRDLVDDDIVVWLRAFPDAESREPTKEAFYDGPLWRELEPAAMSMVEDYSDVTLLSPAEGSALYDFPDDASS